MTSKEIECKTREKEKDRINHAKNKNNNKTKPSQSSETTEDKNFWNSRPSCLAPLKTNIAQKRLIKLRAKLETEIKIKEKLGKIDMKDLASESVVKIENNDVFKKKIKNISSIAKSNQHNVICRNMAADRIKKLKEQLQAKFPSIPRPPSPPPSVPNFSDDQDFSMDVDICMDEESPSKSANQIVDNSDCAAHKPKITSDESNISNPHILDNLDTFYNDQILKIREEPNYRVLHTHLMTDVEMTLTVPIGDLLLVIDTNVYLSDLKLVQDLLKYSIPPFKSPILVLPWPIIQEVDYLMKRKDRNLANHARSANIFINESLKKKHPRIFGQSLSDFKDNFKKTASVDDFILQYCLKFRSFDNHVVLITNDRNLSSKAMLSQLPVYNSKEFKNNFPFSK